MVPLGGGRTVSIGGIPREAMPVMGGGGRGWVGEEEEDDDDDECGKDEDGGEIVEGRGSD